MAKSLEIRQSNPVPETEKTSTTPVETFAKVQEEIKERHEAQKAENERKKTAGTLVPDAVLPTLEKKQSPSEGFSMDILNKQLLEVKEKLSEGKINVEEFEKELRGHLGKMKDLIGHKGRRMKDAEKLVDQLVAEAKEELAKAPLVTDVVTDPSATSDTSAGASSETKTDIETPPTPEPESATEATKEKTFNPSPEAVVSVGDEKLATKEISEEEKRKQLKESVRKRAEAGWEISVNEGKTQKREDFIAEYKKGVENRIREEKRTERRATLDRAGKNLLADLAGGHGVIEKGQDVINLFDAGLSVEDIKNIKSGFLSRKISSPKFDKPMKQEEFNAWVREKIEAGDKEISEAAEKELGGLWDNYRLKSIGQTTDAYLARIDAKAKELEEKVAKAEEVKKEKERLKEEKIKERKESKDLKREGITEEEKQELVKEKLGLLEGLRSKWRDAQKIDFALRHGRRIKTQNGYVDGKPVYETFDPKTEEGRIELENALHRLSDEIINNVDDLTGMKLRPAAMEETKFNPKYMGEAMDTHKAAEEDYRRCLTTRVKEAFYQQKKDIEDATGKLVRFGKPKKTTEESSVANEEAREEAPDGAKVVVVTEGALEGEVSKKKPSRRAKRQAKRVELGKDKTKGKK